MELDVERAGLLLRLIAHALSLHEDDVSDMLRHAVACHVDDLLGVLAGAHNRGHLGLIEDKLDLFNAHRVVKADDRDAVVHGGDQRNGPLPPVLGPDSQKVHRGAIFALDHGAEVVCDDALGKVHAELVRFLHSLPTVLAKGRLFRASLAILADELSGAQKWHARILGDVVLEHLEQGARAILLRRLLVEAVVVLGLHPVADQLVRESVLPLLVFPPRGVLHRPVDAVAAGATCCNH